MTGNHCGCRRDSTASSVTSPIAHARPLIVWRAAVRPCSAIASTSTPRYAATRPSSIVVRSALSDQPVASPVHSAKPASRPIATQPAAPIRAGRTPASAPSSTIHQTAMPTWLRTIVS